MIRVRVYGLKHDPELRTTVKKAITFALQELLPRKRCLYLTVKCANNLLETEGAYGLCYSTTDIHTYYIDLHLVQCAKEFLLTLFHELVHVKQFTLKELVYHGDYELWHGVRYKSKECEYSRPWEKEARRMEALLYKRFMKL